MMSVEEMMASCGRLSQGYILRLLDMRKRAEMVLNDPMRGQEHEAARYILTGERR